MPEYTQTDRPLKITTPLGADVLLLTGLHGSEEMSQLFDFQVDLLTDLKNEVRFDKIIGQSVTVEMRLLDGNKRYFNGIVKRFSQGLRDENFQHFQAEIVPKVWLLTKKVRSRIFQHITVPDILRQVLTGLDVNYDISGTYYPRDYCVQYRESDFDFVSRLMEEEGIYYFFNHSDGGHQMVVSDSTGMHPTVPGQSSAIYGEVGGEVRTDMRVLAWKKIQELRSGECTLWDYCFELPGNHLEAKEKTIESVPVGKVVHKLNIANNQLELYDYPGCYAQRFDGIDPSGGDRPADIAQIFADRTRIVRLRMEQEEVLGIQIEGRGDCGQFLPGHKFTLDRHFDADASYLLTRVEHEASDESYRSDQAAASGYRYQNRFACIPETLRYRPQRMTLRPVIAGMQTATVVGPAGEEVFVDKYGRVKVQFHWDREGKMNADSSCWMRVSQFWAGAGWGAFFWPRIGHEVIVIFEEGDPDQPLVIGSVYNANNMPFFSLPFNKDMAGIKSASVRGTASQDYNGIIFVDRKEQEHLVMHSERHMVFNAEFDKTFVTGRHSGESVPGVRSISVGVQSGGGSGGDPTSLLPKPTPKAAQGLNSTFVLGSNFGFASPLSESIVLGSSVSCVINPIAAAAYGFGTGGSTGGLVAGGKIELVFGTNASVTIGQRSQVNVGPEKIEYNLNDGGLGPAIKIAGMLVSGVAVVFGLAYAVTTDDDTRAHLTLGAQFLVQLILATTLKLAQATKDALYAARLLRIKAWNSNDLTKLNAKTVFFAALPALGAALIPVVAASALEPEVQTKPK